jgi:autotransporter translocation and assembly factor TamB
VLASWHAPDGTVVYLEVRGTVREATLRLESDPALSQAEIQALLLGGGGSGEGGGDAQAAGIGYGADFLSEVLADTPLRNVELRTGSETTADDRSYSTYTAAIPISENIWFEGSYKNLETADASERGSAFSGTIDWRFRRNWSLRTEVGTIGTGLDLLWQYRY